MAYCKFCRICRQFCKGSEDCTDDERAQIFCENYYGVSGWVGV